MYIRVLYITYDIVPALSLCISRMNTRKGAVSVVRSFFRWIKREMLEWDIFMYL